MYVDFVPVYMKEPPEQCTKFGGSEYVVDRLRRQNGLGSVAQGRSTQGIDCRDFSGG